jgi:hypothetical protein
VSFEKPGWYVIDEHTLSVHSWGEAVTYFDPDSDERFERVSNPITPMICADAIIQMVSASQFDGLCCGACPMACLDRVIKHYRAARPHSTMLDFSTLVFCLWAVRKFDQAMDWHPFEANLLPFDFPALFNEVPRVVPNRKISLGKSHC